jgi:hypothetical protein
MIITKLNHPGHEENGTDVVICSATHVVKKTEGRTAVLADRAAPRGLFRGSEMPLFDIDYTGGTAWVFTTKLPFGYITPMQRLWVLLGYTIIVGEYDITALGAEPAVLHFR